MEQKDSIQKVAGWILHQLKEGPDAPMSEELARFVSSSEENAHLYERLKNTEILADLLQTREEYAVNKEHNWGRIIQAARPVNRFTRPRWWAAAAVFVILSGIGIYHLLTTEKNVRPSVAAVVPADIKPGKNGAVLTLADGTQVVLDSLGNGVVATQNGARILLKNGRLAYDPDGANTGEVMYNTMNTPNGRQFQMVLPDGTAVWLNAASSIRYPTVFEGKERRVEITGEAYFEVAKNAEMPFRVNILDRAEVEVLGTHFNINAYESGTSINTTLLEGAVSIGRLSATDDSQNVKPGVNTGNSVLLKPGQQAQIGNVAANQLMHSGNDIKIVSDPDLDKVMAWKNGAFNFEGLTLEEVMRELERWYNIKVQFKGSASNRMFWGGMRRDVNLSIVLDMFKEMGVKYEWKDDTLIIL